MTASNASEFGDALMKNWTIEKTLADMDKAGTATAMLSVTTPGVNFTKGDPARRLCREADEYAANWSRNIPGRLGNFAMLPLTDAEGSLREIAYALDTLKADGIALMTSYGDKWLGDPLFLPAMEELQPPQGAGLHPSDRGQLLRQSGADAATGHDRIWHRYDAHHRRHRFLRQRTPFPDISWIFSHAGGTMPFLIERFVRNPLLDPKAKLAVPDGTLPN